MYIEFPKEGKLRENVKSNFGFIARKISNRKLILLSIKSVHFYFISHTIDIGTVMEIFIFAMEM